MRDSAMAGHALIVFAVYLFNAMKQYLWYAYADYDKIISEIF